MMSKDPAFLFYSSDFLTGCSDLTMEERGQYITLICLQHQKGHLTKKIIDISVGSISQDVLNKFDIDENGLYFNKRIEDVIEKRKNYTESRRKNGSLGGRPKKPYGLPYAKPYGKPTENLLENENINENKNENENNLINKMLKKSNLKTNQFFIDDCFKITDIPEIEVYEKEVGTELVNKVQSWLLEKKYGEVVDKQFICKQIINFSKRQGLL